MGGKAKRSSRPVPQNGVSKPDELLALLQQGIQQHQAGNTAVAATMYQQVLDQAPDQPDALHLMGVIRYQNGDHEEAIALIRRAIKRNPKNPDAYSNLGAAQIAAGDLNSAAKSLKRAIKIKPDYLDAHANLAALSVRRGADNDAIRSFHTAHKLSPAEPRFMMRLAELYLKHDQFAEAADWFERYLSVSPDDADGHNNAAFAYDNLYQFEEAENHYRRATELDPAKPEIANNWANTLRRLGRVEEAEQVLECALQSDPGQWEDLSHYAGALFNNGNLGKALALFESLVLERPEDGALHRDYGSALVKTGRSIEAEEALRRALQLCPEQDATRIELAHCLLRNKKTDEAARTLVEISAKSPHYLAACLDLCLVYAGSERLEEAVKVARKAAAHRDFKSSMFVKPYSVYRAACAFDDIDALPGSIGDVEDRDLSAWAGLFIELLAYADTAEKVADLVALHGRWSDKVVKSVADDALDESPVVRRSGPVRLGFLSTDLYKHSVARFIVPLLENYDRDQFDIYCYSPDEDADDDVQRRIRGLVREFRVFDKAPYRDIAQMIRDDGIDILFELNGFTPDSRLNVMAYRPAPVQIYWLGYPGTTGMSTMDYILLDKFNVPENPEWVTEKPLLMPGSWVCYEPFEQVVRSAQPPVSRNGVITFGTLNNLYKFTRQGVALWAEVIRQVPGSRFLSVHPEHATPLMAANLTQEFERNGITADRLSFVNNREATLSHFSYYEEIDISLDTVPLTGGTTTADALWCGVPVVTLVGPGMHQRMSYSLLSNVGAGELCAETPEQYVANAVDLAGDIGRLTDYRRNLPQNFRASALGDAPRFAQEFQTLMLDVVNRHGLR